MKKLAALMFILVATFTTPTLAQPTTLPPDINSGICSPGNWDNCIGIRRYGNGNTYVGEFRNGIREGFGKLRILARGRSGPGYVGSETPSTYIGEFKDDMLNGHGIWTTDTGERYEGDFKNNIMITHLRPTIVIQPAAPACCMPPQMPAPAQVAPEHPTAMQCCVTAAPTPTPTPTTPTAPATPNP